MIILGQRVTTYIQQAFIDCFFPSWLLGAGDIKIGLKPPKYCRNCLRLQYALVRETA